MQVPFDSSKKRKIQMTQDVEDQVFCRRDVEDLMRKIAVTVMRNNKNSVDKLYPYKVSQHRTSNIMLCGNMLQRCV